MQSYKTFQLLSEGSEIREQTSSIEEASVQHMPHWQSYASAGKVVRIASLVLVSEKIIAFSKGVNPRFKRGDVSLI